MVLHIFFRQTGDILHKVHPIIRPHWFNYEKCFYNFVNTLIPSINDVEVKFNIMFDGDINNTFTQKYINNPSIPTNTMQAHSQGNEWHAGKMLWTFLKDQYQYNDNDIIYLVENDYVHAPGWVEVLLNLFKTHNATYASLYDHNDKYFLEMYDNLQSPIICTKYCHWRGVPNTTGTFAMRGKCLREDINEHLGIEGDFHKFKALVDNKGRSVYTPIPGYSTHCMNDLLSPLINWEKILNETYK